MTVPFPGRWTINSGFDREVVTIAVAAIPVGAAVLFVRLFVRRAFTLTGSSPLLVCWGEGDCSSGARLYERRSRCGWGGTAGVGLRVEV